MSIAAKLLLTAIVLLGSGGLSFAQDEFYNRDSSGYTYRIGPVLPKIQQDWQLGSLGQRFHLRLQSLRCEHRELRPEPAQSSGR